MTNPAFALAGAMDALDALSKTISRARVPISGEVFQRLGLLPGLTVLDMGGFNRRAGTRGRP
jgi:hypothetical protein